MTLSENHIIQPEMMAFSSLRYLQENRKLATLSKNTFQKFFHLMEKVLIVIQSLEVRLFASILILS